MADFARAFVRPVSRDRRTVAAFLNDTERLASSPDANIAESLTCAARFHHGDVPLVFWTGGRVIEATATVAPDYWRRYLGVLPDGVRAAAATPLPAPPLTRAQLARAAGRRER